MSNFDALINDAFSISPQSDACNKLAERSGCNLQYMSIDHLGMSARFQGDGQKNAYFVVSNDGGAELFVRQNEDEEGDARAVCSIEKLEEELTKHFLEIK